ncbi:MAG: hypothetical protein IJ740_17200 [Ruminococcus sp.]|nr:hypothetical protein [Ruminococcus sp.]
MLSVLFITDAEHLHEDIEYLGGAAVDIIQKPIEPKLLGNRIDNAEKLTNSVSFNEFARMLKVLPANIYLKDANGRYVFSSQTWHHLYHRGKRRRVGVFAADKGAAVL